jgi:hypothetical protein
VHELKENITLTKDENRILDIRYSRHVDEETHELIIQCKEKGIDYKNALKKLLGK